MQFREVMRPPLWLLAFIYFMFLSLIVAVWAALGTGSAIFAGVILTILLLVIAVMGRSEILVDEEELRIQDAHINRRFIGNVKVLNAAEMKLIRTRDADPAAYLAIKFWVTTGVRITLNDQRDPTPYWLVSCKKAEELKNTLCKQL
jgi:hypothetical protein